MLEKATTGHGHHDAAVLSAAMAPQANDVISRSAPSPPIRKSNGDFIDGSNITLCNQHKLKSLILNKKIENTHKYRHFFRT